MRSFLSLALLAVLTASSAAQCPNGVCPTSTRRPTALTQAPPRRVTTAFSSVSTNTVSTRSSAGARKARTGILHRIFHRGI